MYLTTRVSEICLTPTKSRPMKADVKDNFHRPRGGQKGCEKLLGIDRKELKEIDGFFAVLLWRDYKRNNNSNLEIRSLNRTKCVPGR